MRKPIPSHYHELVEEAASAPLSRLLPRALTLARGLQNEKLEKWVRLEMEGYYGTNPALTGDDEVPEYRTVVGQRHDDSGRPLVLTDPKLRFVNEDRLRNGIAELEHFAASKGMIAYRDLDAAPIVREFFGVEAAIFSFHPSEIHGLLSRVRARFMDWLSDVQPEVDRLDRSSSLTGISPSKGQRPRLKQRLRELRWKDGLGIVGILIGLIVLVVGNNLYLQITGHSFFASPTPTPSETPSFTSTPAPPSGTPLPATDAPARTDYDIVVYPNCDCDVTLTGFESVLVRLRWGAETSSLAEEGANSIDFTLTIDGLPIQEINDYRRPATLVADPVFSRDRKDAWYVYWDYPLGALPVGDHIVEATLRTLTDISTGWNTIESPTTLSFKVRLVVLPLDVHPSPR